MRGPKEIATGWAAPHREVALAQAPDGSIQSFPVLGYALLHSGLGGTWVEALVPDPDLPGRAIPISDLEARGYLLRAVVRVLEEGDLYPDPARPQK